MFRTFSRTIIGDQITYLRHKYVWKLNIINLRAHKFCVALSGEFGVALSGEFGAALSGQCSFSYVFLMLKDFFKIIFF
jgi:hypothetical protein